MWNIVYMTFYCKFISWEPPTPIFLTASLVIQDHSGLSMLAEFPKHSKVQNSTLMECRDCKAAQMQTAAFLELMIWNRWCVHWDDEQKSDKVMKTTCGCACVCVWMCVYHLYLEHFTEPNNKIMAISHIKSSTTANLSVFTGDHKLKHIHNKYDFMEHHESVIHQTLLM